MSNPKASTANNIASNNHPPSIPTRTASAIASVRDNAFTFDGPDDFGMAQVMRTVNSLDIQSVHGMCGTLLLQFTDTLVGLAPAFRRNELSAVLEAAAHNHNYLWAQYQQAAIATGSTGESQSQAQMQYLNSLWQSLEAAIPVAYTALDHGMRAVAITMAQPTADEREKLAAVLRQGFQDAELAQRGELAAVYLHAMATADFLYCAAVGFALRVPSPEMWPVPPEVWKPHRAAMASVEHATAVALAVR